MKKLLAAAIVAGASLLASAAEPVWTLFKGASIVQPRVAYPSRDECAKGAAAQVVPKAATYRCKASEATSAVDANVTTKTTVDTTIAVTVLPPPVMTAGLKINTAKVPKAGVGSTTEDLLQVGRIPSASSDGTGDFRTVCQFSHMAFDDPIVYPGQSGRSHLHAFFGNTGANANSTAASIANTGNSTCRGGTINRSAYWQPPMIDTADGTPIKPDMLIAYYKSGYHQVAPKDIHELPPGLRMVAGDSTGSAPVVWGPTHFKCETKTGETNHWELPTACPVGGVVWAMVDFPQCWDGVNLDSPDHRSHMAYGGIGQGVKPGCPDTHPVALSAITLNVLYTVTDAAALKRWRLSSDVYDKSQPAGYSLHADWFNGWKPEVVKVWTTQCVQAGKDCGADMLGDGRSMAEGKQ